VAVVAFFYLLRFSLSLSLFVSRFRVLIFRIVSLSLRIVDARAFRPFARMWLSDGCSLLSLARLLYDRFTESTRKRKRGSRTKV